jgi:hypothetical protein
MFIPAIIERENEEVTRILRFFESGERNRSAERWIACLRAGFFVA